MLSSSRALYIAPQCLACLSFRPLRYFVMIYGVSAWRTTVSRAPRSLVRFRLVSSFLPSFLSLRFPSRECASPVIFSSTVARCRERMLSAKGRLLWPGFGGSRRVVATSGFPSMRIGRGSNKVWSRKRDRHPRNAGCSVSRLSFALLANKYSVTINNNPQNTEENYICKFLQRTFRSGRNFRFIRLNFNFNFGVF